jgi:hypothetical protein
MTRALHLNGRPQGEESSVFPASTVRRMLDRYSVRMSMALTRLRDHRHGIERAGFLLPDLSPELLEALEPTDDFDGLEDAPDFSEEELAIRSRLGLPIYDSEEPPNVEHD